MQVFLVGGAVRDSLLGLECHDKDFVVVGANPQMLLEQGFSQVGQDFPVFLHPDSHHEYALARLERKIGTGHTAFSTVFDDTVSLQDDLLRRDLTINALAIQVVGLFDDTPVTGQVIDYYGGLSDLQNKVLRHVSPAFAEDPLRILRTARFFAKFAGHGFVIADETKSLMIDMANRGELSHLSRERLWAESSKAMSHNGGHAYWQVLFELGILAYFLPPLDKLWRTPDNYRCTIHALEILAQTPFYQALPKDKQDALAFALLLSSSESLDDISDTALRLCTPKIALELANLVFTFKDCFATTPTADMVINLIECTKAQQQLKGDSHNPHATIYQLLTALDVYHQAWGVRTVINFNQQQSLIKQAVTIYQTTTIKDIDPSLKGAQIGQALTKVRAQRIKQLLIHIFSNKSV